MWLLLLLLSCLIYLAYLLPLVALLSVSLLCLFLFMLFVALPCTSPTFVRENVASTCTSALHRADVDSSVATGSHDGTAPAVPSPPCRSSCRVAGRCTMQSSAPSHCWSE